MGPAKSLLYAVLDYLDAHYAGWRVTKGVVPDGLRIELHPAAYHEIVHDYDLSAPPWQISTLTALERVLQIPVKVTPELPDGSWRLVVVTENVLLGGTLLQPLMVVPKQEAAL